VLQKLIDSHSQLVYIEEDEEMRFWVEVGNWWAGQKAPQGYTLNSISVHAPASRPDTDTNTSKILTYWAMMMMERKELGGDGRKIPLRFRRKPVLQLRVPGWVERTRKSEWGVVRSPALYPNPNPQPHAFLSSSIRRHYVKAQFKRPKLLCVEWID
jgi:hypothetical protein